MNHPLPSIFVSIVVLAGAARAPGGEFAEVLSLQLTGGRTIAGCVVQQDGHRRTIRYRGLSTVVTESVPQEEVVTVAHIIPTARPTWTVEQVTDHFDAATLAQVAQILLFESTQSP